METYTQYSYKASPNWRWRNSYYLNKNYQLFQQHLKMRESHDTFNTIKTTT